MRHQQEVDKLCAVFRVHYHPKILTEIHWFAVTLDERINGLLFIAVFEFFYGRHMYKQYANV